MQRLKSTLPLLVLTFSLATAPPRVPAQGAGPPPAFVQGPTVAATVRNGIQAASDQARLTAKTAADMGARARSSGYQMQNLEVDCHNLRLQFQSLRAIVKTLANLTAQSPSARTANAAAELDAGLSIITEAIIPVQLELKAGAPNRDTIVRMCEVISQALKEWDKELRKDSPRLESSR